MKIKFFFIYTLLITALLAQEPQMKLTSLNFKNKETLAQKHTCYGQSLSPQLSWNFHSKDVKSFVLIVDDPDAVGGMWNHWIVYDIPSTTTSINEGEIHPKGSKLALTTNGKKTYIAPCPPKGSGKHGYRFRIYALDIENLNPKGLSKENIEDTMQGHILSQDILIGYVEKKKKFLFF